MKIELFKVATRLFGFLILIALMSVNSFAELKVGDLAPAFSLLDVEGKTHGLAEYKGKYVVLEWTNPDCPFVKRHYKAGTMASLSQKYSPKGVVWLAINSSRSGTAEKAKAWIDEQHLNYPLLDDRQGDVGRAYGAKTTPHLFVIDTAGKIAYQGAIDNNPDGQSENVVNYVESALEKLLAGKPVDPETTKPYGCSVKY